ncbi:DUF3239 domain-containing protein [Amycolatopsis magusensis]|uniref:DUF3239 domain-containing protein n=1 Tax=Amycolatopsis magusensis TaxID=882444 RepID=UPI0037B18FD1
MPRVSESAWPAGDPRRFFDAPIDADQLRASSPNIHARAIALLVGVVAGVVAIALGWWAIADGRWWSVVLGVLVLVAGLYAIVRGFRAEHAVKPFRGGQLVPGVVVQQADGKVEILVLGDISRDPVSPPRFAYRLIAFRAREGTQFVPGQWVPCVMHGFVGPGRRDTWWNFEASPVSWATADASVLESADRMIPEAEWNQLLAGAERITELRRRASRLLLIPDAELPDGLRRPPSRIGVPVEWQETGRARFVGSLSDRAHPALP